MYKVYKNGAIHYVYSLSEDDKKFFYEEIKTIEDNHYVGIIHNIYSDLQKENKLLKAQLKAQTERSDFIEDCIAEIAGVVYNTEETI